MTQFPSLSRPTKDTVDAGIVRLGSGCITGGFPELKRPKAEIEDHGTVRLGSGCITGKLPGISRRHLFSTVALGAVALAAGCTQLSQTAAKVDAAIPTLQTVASKISDALTIITPALPTITAAIGVAGATATKIEGWIAEGKAVASSIASGASSTVGGLATTLATDASYVVAALKPGSATSTLLASLLPAVETLVPALLKLAGVAIPMAAAPMAAAPMAAAPMAAPSMSVTQAMSIIGSLKAS
jgi:hypothetical protein